MVKGAMVNTMAPFSVFTYRTHRLARGTSTLRPEKCEEEHVIFVLL
mgnify:CR=1 FL=1